MPQDAPISIKQLLFQNWATSNPSADTAYETFEPRLVYFTTRMYATNPDRIHAYQVSVVSGGWKETPEEVGSIVMYKVEETIHIHVWALTGIGDDVETVRVRARNMMDAIDVILRLGSVSEANVGGIQFIRISPGWSEPRDFENNSLIFHRVKEMTAVYYRTDVQLPFGKPIILPTFPVLQADIGLADQSSAG